MNSSSFNGTATKGICFDALGATRAESERLRVSGFLPSRGVRSSRDTKQDKVLRRLCKNKVVSAEPNRLENVLTVAFFPPKELKSVANAVIAKVVCLHRRK